METENPTVAYTTYMYMSRFANNGLLGGGVRVRVGVRGQRKVKRSRHYWWQFWTSVVSFRRVSMQS